KNRPNVFGSYRTYCEAILDAGGSPFILSPFRSEIPLYTKMIDGLLLTGGGDVHPKYFGEKLPKVKLELSPDERTRFEIKMVQSFLKTKKPMLGVCLGSQTIAVAMGGKLIQDIPTELRTRKNHRKGNHTVWVDRASKLRKIVGKNEFL